jgi:two-component system sensor histidine kinase PilS (NtrC family)
MLVVLAVRLFGDGGEPEGLRPADVAAFVIVGAAYLATLVTAVFLRKGGRQASLVWSQVGLDIALASGVVELSGGLESPLTFVSSIAIIGGAALLGRRGALVSAGLSVVALGVSVSAGFEGLSARMTTPRLLLAVALQAVAQVLVATLAGHLAEQLLRKSGQLFDRERDLRELTNLQDRIVAAMPSGLLTCDRERRITFINPAGAAILGIDGVAVRGSPLARLLPGIEGVLSPRRAELQFPTAGGVRTLGLSVVDLDARQGSLLIVFQDLTEVRRLEAELERIDHLAQLGSMSAQLAHEVRNPLAAMRGSAQLLAKDAEGTQQERLARLVLRECDRLAALVDGYLTLARPPPPTLARVRVDEVVAETIEMFRADPAQARIRLQSSLEPVEASMDAGQFKQVLINLLRNAAAATRGQGEVRVSVRQADGPLVEVWDDAGALAEEDRERIFEPFFSRQKGGTGLGLTTARSIVHAHGGTIGVRSAPGVGTTFSIKLGPTPEAPHGQAAAR